MIKSLTFKEYLESKEQLRKAIEKTPQQVVEYSVRKYCKLSVGESKGDNESVNLKPKNKIQIEWLYEDVDNPTPIKLWFDGVKDVGESDEFSTYLTGSNLIKWLQRNTKELPR